MVDELSNEVNKKKGKTLISETFFAMTAEFFNKKIALGMGDLGNSCETNRGKLKCQNQPNITFEEELHLDQFIFFC